MPILHTSILEAFYSNVGKVSTLQADLNSIPCLQTMETGLLNVVGGNYCTLDCRSKGNSAKILSLQVLTFRKVHKCICTKCEHFTFP